jgi:hypothetical protein
MNKASSIPPRAVRTALVDTASAIRTALNNHITNDEDTDSTNEYNTGFEVNGTGDSLIISDAGTRFAVAIEDVIDTSNLYTQILLNRDSINLNEQGIIDSTGAVRTALVDTASAIRTALNDHITSTKTRILQTNTTQALKSTEQETA